MKIDRMFGIVYLLMRNERMSARQLAEHFEVSPRTIQRDIESLMQAGIPLYSARGSEGGVSLVESFALNKALLTPDEQARILWGLQSLPKQSTSDGETLNKLSALFNHPFPDWIEVDFSRWGHKEKDDERFAILRRAILEGRSIRFRYAGGNEILGEREVYPLKLVFKSKAWYLQAYCLARSDYRTFKINRMSSINAGGKVFERSQFPVPALESESAPCNFVTLELIFDLCAASRVFDEFDIDSIEVSEGSIHVYTTYPDDAYLYSLLASFGSNVRVVEPAAVREKLARH